MPHLNRMSKADNPITYWVLMAVFILTVPLIAFDRLVLGKHTLD
jgi:membrane-associated phospholipid phosphatase